LWLAADRHGSDDGPVPAPNLLMAGHLHSDPGAPTGVAYSLLLIAHVASAVVGFGALAMTGLHASRVTRGPGAKSAESVRRYFQPGVNWVGRALYLVPVIGFGLVADSAGAYDTSDGFVIIGLLIWLVAAALAEFVVWPGERRIQGFLAGGWDETRELERECRRVVRGSLLLGVMFVAAVVVMFAKP
jgi:uncharacterized membrane protein